MNDWLPINTAPKDGSEILAYDPSLFGVTVAYWSEYDGWFVPRESQDGMGFGDMPLTHWMPLPGPPKFNE